MAALTPDEIINDLDDGLQWRRTELQAMRTAARAIAPNEAARPANRATLRSCVVLLYAHWEGYTKDSCQAYLNYVARRGMKAAELSDSFIRTSVLALAKRADRDPQALDLLQELARRGGDMRLAVPKRKVVETGSNLRFAVLSDILTALGLSTMAFETRGQLIDRELCDARNAIAHGKANFPDQAAVEQLFDNVIQLLSDVRDVLVSAVRTTAYRAEPATGT